MSLGKQNLLKKMIRLYRHIKSKPFGWRGSYASWSEAQMQCTGYSASNILNKVRSATLKVKNGEAIYERDSMLFDKIEYSWPLLCNLLWIANQNEGKLSVIDFGGSLGSSYFQNRLYLDGLKEVKWSVVEQNEFVMTGQREISDDKLQFFFSIEEAMNKRGKPDVLVLSCVLPYLENPYEFLGKILNKGFQYIIVDNTYFNPGTGDRLTVQKVPPVFYEASYPAWFLDYKKVLTTFQVNYEIVAEYVNDQFIYFYGEKIAYRGFIMKLNSNNKPNEDNQ